MNLDFSNIIQGSSLALSQSQLNQLWMHWMLIKQWNKRTNLTSLKGDVEAAWLHYRDSLEVVAHLPPLGTLADMGSGAGFPGIPLAIACPQRNFHLVEPRSKRASFLRFVVGRLQLPNITILRARSTDVPPQLYTGILSRATFSKEDSLLECLSWLTPSGVLIAFRSGDAPHLSFVKRTISYKLGIHERRLDFVDKSGVLM